MDRARAAEAVAALLRSLDRNPDTEPELLGTPARVAAAFIDELLVGYHQDVSGLLAQESIAGVEGLIVVRDIDVATTCPHHLMSGLGRATVALQASGRGVGIGAIGRVVDAFARRLTLQETIGHEVTRALAEALEPAWVGCRIVLTHACMTARGERRHGTSVETVALRGVNDPMARAEAYRVLAVGS